MRLSDVLKYTDSLCTVAVQEECHDTVLPTELAGHAVILHRAPSVTDWMGVIS